jgi:hypothetical protein
MASARARRKQRAADRPGPGRGFWLLACVGLPWAALLVSALVNLTLLTVAALVAWLALIGLGSAAVLALRPRLQRKPVAARVRWAALGGMIASTATLAWFAVVVLSVGFAVCGFGDACG